MKKQILFAVLSAIAIYLFTAFIIWSWDVHKLTTTMRGVMLAIWLFVNVAYKLEQMSKNED